MKTVSLERVREVLQDHFGENNPSLKHIMDRLEEPEKQTAIEALSVKKVILYRLNDLIYKMIGDCAHFWLSCDKKWELSVTFCCEKDQNSTDWEEVDDPSVPKFKRNGGGGCTWMVEDQRKYTITAMVFGQRIYTQEYVSNSPGAIWYPDRRRTQ